MRIRWTVPAAEDLEGIKDYSEPALPTFRRADRALRFTTSGSTRVGQERRGVGNHRTCGQSAVGTTPVWCPAGLCRLPALAPSVPVAFRSQPVYTAPHRRAGVWWKGSLSGCGSRRPIDEARHEGQQPCPIDDVAHVAGSS
jgi:hypothetical protein